MSSMSGQFFNSKNPRIRGGSFAGTSYGKRRRDLKVPGGEESSVYTTSDFMNSLNKRQKGYNV